MSFLSACLWKWDISSCLLGCHQILIVEQHKMNCAVMSRDKTWDPCSLLWAFLTFLHMQGGVEGETAWGEKILWCYRVGTGPMDFIFQSLGVLFSFSVLLSLLQNASDNPWLLDTKCIPLVPRREGEARVGASWWWDVTCWDYSQ